MKILFDAYDKDAPIPVQRYLSNRKLVKYFNRETAAAVVCAARLLEGESLDPGTPFYYESGIMEYENLGLDEIARESVDANGAFSQQGFVQEGAKAVPPLTQFKALYNMPLSFVSIEQGLNGDNGVVYASARALLELALCAPPAYEAILLGSGKIQADGMVECGFALVDRESLVEASLPDEGIEGIELLRHWAGSV
jgi:hypothetical protein